MEKIYLTIPENIEQRYCETLSKIKKSLNLSKEYFESVIGYVNMRFLINKAIEPNSLYKMLLKLKESNLSINEQIELIQTATNENWLTINPVKGLDELCKELDLTNVIKYTFLDYIEMRKQINCPLTINYYKPILLRLKELSNNDKVQELIIEQSINKGWKWFFELQ